MSDPTPDLFKDLGNRAFSALQFSLAIQHYTDAINLIKNDASIVPIDYKSTIIPALLSNRAMCHSKLHNHKLAVDDASEGLKIIATTNEAAAYALINSTLHPMYVKLSYRLASNQLTIAKTTKSRSLQRKAIQVYEDLLLLPHIDNATRNLIEAEMKSIISPPVTSSDPTPSNEALRLTQNQGVDVTGMTMADIKRMNEANQQIDPNNSVSTPAKPKLQGVWARGGGKSLSAKLSAEGDGKPIVIKSKEALQFEKDIQNQLEMERVQGNQNEREFGPNNSQNIDNQCHKNATLKKNDVTSPKPLPKRLYTAAHLNHFVQQYNTTHTSLSSFPTNFSSPQLLPYYGTLYTNTNTNMTPPHQKSQWRNASMKPRSIDVLSTDFDTTSEVEDGDNAINTKYRNDFSNTIGPKSQKITEKLQKLDQNKFDGVDCDETSDDDVLVEKKRFLARKKESQERGAKNKILNQKETADLRAENALLSHIHDGCLGTLQPSRVDDAVVVLCANQYGLLMVGKRNRKVYQQNDINMNFEAQDNTVSIPDHQSEYYNWSIPVLHSSTFVTPPKVEGFSISTTAPSNLTEIQTNTPSSIIKPILSTLSSTQQDLPSPSDLSLTALQLCFEKCPTIYKDIDIIQFNGLYGVEEYPSLQFPRRLRYLMNISMELREHALDALDAKKGKKHAQHWFSTSTGQFTHLPSLPENCLAFIPLSSLSFDSKLPLEDFQFLTTIEALASQLNLHINNNIHSQLHPFQTLTQRNSNEFKQQLIKQRIQLPILDRSEAPEDQEDQDQEDQDQEDQDQEDQKGQNGQNDQNGQNGQMVSTSPVTTNDKCITLPPQLPFIGTHPSHFTSLTQDLRDQLKEYHKLNIRNTAMIFPNDTQLTLFQPFHTDFSLNYNTFSKTSHNNINPSSTPDTPSRRQHYPFSTLETVLLSTVHSSQLDSPQNTLEPAILLVQRQIIDPISKAVTIVWGLPITHVDDSDSISFTSTRLMHSLFGILNESWSLIDYIPSLSQQDMIQHDYLIESLGFDPKIVKQLPNDYMNEYSSHKGAHFITFSQVYGKHHKSSTSTAMSSYWPSRTKPALVNYKWVTLTDLSHMSMDNATNTTCEHMINPLVYQLSSQILSHYNQYQDILSEIANFDTNLPNLSSHEQHTVQKYRSESSQIDVPFHFGGLLSIDTLNKTNEKQ